jgi:hypothetical protein
VPESVLPWQSASLQQLKSLAQMEKLQSIGEWFSKILLAKILVTKFFGFAGGRAHNYAKA